MAKLVAATNEISRLIGGRRSAASRRR